MNPYSTQVHSSIELVETKPRRMRTLSALAEHYRNLDPDTAITEHFLRQQILAGKIPVTYAGNKRLIDIDDSDYFLSSASTTTVTETKNRQVRRID